MDNIEHLKDAKLFIAHGRKDKCVHYSKSVAYYKKIIDQFPGKKDSVTLRLYSGGDHGIKTTNLAAKDFFEWLGL